ncbi:MAG: GNAT family N-acetyltransferase [Dysgonamonadaceae bacterium]|jgi:diamine N-acetyltransferase|nr:GNAT family N-acetyltransferase [Dysgonamonadaceae bacterium]
MNVFFEHNNLLLRALEPEDIDILYAWENDSELWKYGASVSPLSRYAIRQYLDEARQDIYQTRQLRLMITLRKDGREQRVGLVDLFDFDPQHLRAGVGILIAPDFQKQGLGTQSLRLIQRYAFDFLHLSQLYAHIPRQNTASIRLFRKVGFCESGVLKNWARINDAFSDVLILQLFQNPTVLQ